MKRKNYFKWIISMFFLMITPIIAYMHQVKGGGVTGSPSVDALCPLGGLETLSSLIKDGTYIKRIAPSSLIILISIIILTILLGRIFCGYICPLGTIQTLINKLAKKLKIAQITPNKKIEKILRYSKYIVLIFVLFTTYKAGELILRPLDPWATFMHLGSGSELFSEFLIGFVILVLIFITSLFIERAWCRYFCPLGAFLAIISPFRIFKVNRNSSTCISCNKCTQNCPMGIAISNEITADSKECISCGECITACPVSETLDMKKGKYKLSLKAIATTVVLVLTLVIGGIIISGNFKTALNNKETLIQNGIANPDNIRGYMTLNDISKEFKIKHSELLKECGLPQNIDLNKPIKDLKIDLSKKNIIFETEDLREAIKKILKQ